jgi:cellulose synthase/poly-beta-1,6-N-acetylglucosamine synthase-like glycosyltransferase
MIVLSLVVALVAGLLLLPTLSDLISLVRIVFASSPSRAAVAREQQPRLLFLVPAHNEELLISSCIRSLFEMHYPRNRFTAVVIADNCTDRTAELARATGARCLERDDSSRPGKPHAIAWALQHLPMADYEALVIVDADCLVNREFAASLANVEQLDTKALQCYNDVRNRDNALTRMAAVLSAVNHGISYRLKSRAGLNVPLSAGMALGSQILKAHGWKAFSISEDWELYALLTEQGVRIQSVPGARLYAEEARSLAQGAVQRRRWAAGKVTVLVRYGRQLLVSRNISAHQKLDIIAELLISGPAVHAGIVLLALAMTTAVGLPGTRILSALLLASLARPAIYALAAIARDPQPVRALLAFGLFPPYIVWRLGVQVTLKRPGKVPWIRTTRNTAGE